MKTLLLAALIAVGPVTSPKDLSDWKTFGKTEDFVIEIDLNSVDTERKFGGELLIKATVRRVLFKELQVPGKLKGGAFYIDQTVSSCKDDTITIASSALFSKDFEIVGQGTELGVLHNPQDPGNFVTEFLKTVCSVTKNSGRGLTT